MIFLENERQQGCNFPHKDHPKDPKGDEVRRKFVEKIKKMQKEYLDANSCEDSVARNMCHHVNTYKGKDFD